jgi:phenylalanyl-tRNA synthetase beta chain
MIVSRRWLEDLVGRPLPLAELTARLDALGAPVEAVVPLRQDLRGVLVARVLEVRRHPNADRLSLCLVDAGGADGPLEVVCGAPNVTAGKVYPFAPVGTTLPGGLTLERRKIRGVLSNGMLCSARELGLGQDADGILELETGAAPGTALLDALPLADDQIQIEVTANRPDLLGHKGVAREIAAPLGATVKLPSIPGGWGAVPPGAAAEPPIRRATDGVVDGLTVRIEDPEGAPRYLMAVIRGVRVGPSPAWLADRLAAAGQRSINNVVDATNYILLELNQPLHAFDLARLRGPAVVVRRARASEPIVTLDGVGRTLSPDMTVICDAERPTIVAGVMGSAESEVTAATTDIVLECAYFQPTRVRRTRKALGLSSESSYRFERGVDLFAMPEALRRASELIVAVAGGAVREPALDLWPRPEQPRTVFLRAARVAHLLGVPVPRAEIETLLASVGFVAAPKDDRLAVQVPGWRPDVTHEVDLIEEIARLRGYDSFPDELRPFRLGTVPDAPAEQARALVRHRLAAAGMLEARTMPLGPAVGQDAVEVLNPMSAEERFLRTALLPGLIRRVEYNWSLRNRDIRLFEVGATFRRAGTGDPQPEERAVVAGVLSGARRPPHWSDAEKVPDMDIWDLKRHFELAVEAAAPGATVRAAAPGWEAVAPDGTVIGAAGPQTADRPPWAAPVFGFEVRLVPTAAPAVLYRPVPATPAAERDVALVLPGGVTATAVEAVLTRVGAPLLERVEVFDEYRGAGVPAGARSVAWRCTFRDPERTLREQEVDAVLAGMLRALQEELDVRRREG